MTLEDWNTVFQVGSAVLLGLTFAFTAGAILTGIVISKRQAALIATTGRAVAEANRKAAEAGEGTARALADAAGANERAGKLELESAQQHERAARAERELFELRQRVAPRRLSAEQRAIIVATARRPMQATIQVIRLGDAEAQRFADDLITAFQEAGWSVDVGNVGIMASPPYGLIYRTGPTATIPPAAEALLAALKKAGLTISITPGGDADKFVVGLKPVTP